MPLARVQDPSVTLKNQELTDARVPDVSVNNTTVGTIMKTPKAVGGSATVLARDPSPAIAVDANSVYWTDINGYIKSIPK